MSQQPVIQRSDFFLRIKCIYANEISYQGANSDIGALIFWWYSGTNIYFRGIAGITSTYSSPSEPLFVRNLNSKWQADHAQ